MLLKALTDLYTSSINFHIALTPKCRTLDFQISETDYLRDDLEEEVISQLGCSRFQEKLSPDSAKSTLLVL